MKITLHKLDDSQRLQEYFKIREEVFCQKWNYEGYSNYPTIHDKMQNTSFLVFSETDNNGNEIVFGGRRIVPVERSNKNTHFTGGLLPFETKYKIKHGLFTDKIPMLKDKEFFDIENIFPNIKKSTATYCEIGGFAIDITLTEKLFKNKESYIASREKIYLETLNAAKNMNLDFAIIVAQEFNLAKQVEYLDNTNQFAFRYLKSNSNFYDAVMKGDAPLVINLSEKFNLNQMLRNNRESMRIL